MAVETVTDRWKRLKKIRTEASENMEEAAKHRNTIMSYGKGNGN